VLSYKPENIDNRGWQQPADKLGLMTAKGAWEKGMSDEKLKAEPERLRQETPCLKLRCEPFEVAILQSTFQR
jgi:hypothetical protein